MGPRNDVVASREREMHPDSAGEVDLESDCVIDSGKFLSRVRSYAI